MATERSEGVIESMFGKDKLHDINTRIENLEIKVKNLSGLYSKIIELMDSVSTTLSEHGVYDAVTDRITGLEEEIDKLRLDFDDYVKEERKGADGKS